MGQAAVACLDDFQAGNWEIASFLGDGEKKKQAHRLEDLKSRFSSLDQMLQMSCQTQPPITRKSEPIYVFLFYIRQSW